MYYLYFEKNKYKAEGTDHVSLSPTVCCGANFMSETEEFRGQKKPFVLLSNCQAKTHKKVKKHRRKNQTSKDQFVWRNAAIYLWTGTSTQPKS